MAVTVSGASDDLIEIDGAISAEFTYSDEGDEGDLIALSNGILFRVQYTTDGVWSVKQIAGQRDRVSIVPAVGEDDDNYSDVATVDDQISWVVQGSHWSRK